MALTLSAAARKDIAQPTTAKWQHAHFADIARMIRELPDTATRVEVSNLFAIKLAATNPRFDETRFKVACIPY